MKLLAIDTTTEACSAGILINDEYKERFEIAPRKHAELILPMVDELLAESGLKLKDMDALAFARGPGAFTGIRIATGVIQGLAFAADLPVIPISTLAALAQGTSDQAEYILPAIDARMQEIYWGQYQVNAEGIVELINDETVCQPEAVTLSQQSPCFGVGTGWQTYPDVLKSRLNENYLGHDGNSFPHAKDILTLAQLEYNANRLIPAEEALPVYLRNRVTG